MNKTFDVSQLLKATQRYHELQKTIRELNNQLNSAEEEFVQAEMAFIAAGKALFSPDKEEKSAVAEGMDAVAARCSKRLGRSVEWSSYGQNPDGRTTYLCLSTRVRSEMQALTVFLDTNNALREMRGKLEDWVTDPADLQLLTDVLKG